MDINNILFRLLKQALMAQPLELSLFQGMSKDLWNNVYKKAQEQGIAAICFDAIRSLPRDLQPPRGLYIKWALFTERVEDRYRKQESSYSKIIDILGKENLKFMLMKGFSVGKYYPVPSHRECGDIDIYMGEDYAKGNDAFQNAGCHVEADYFRHSHVIVEGVMVENHCMLSDIKTRKDNLKLEQTLTSIANKALNSSQSTAVNPPIDFSALFLNWHCEAHFMFEKIQLRHIYDWMLFLKNEGDKIDMDLFREMKKKCSFGKLSDILTSIALEFLGFDDHDIPAVLVEDARQVDLKLRDKVLTYIMNSERTDKSGNIWLVRYRVLMRTIHDSWKIRKVFGLNPFSVLCKRAWGVLKG